MTPSRPRHVVGILGPTGVGKTAVAVELARRLSTCVISCDSMQIFRGYPLLTNQPSQTERAAARHELVACVEPGVEFSAGDYARLARPIVERELQTSGWAVLAGGTGLYMRAALASLAVADKGDPERRRLLEARAQVDGPEALHAELARADPLAAGSIDPRNVRRVIRALEAVTSTGRPWSGRGDLWAPVYYHPTSVFGLTLERVELYRRIGERAAQIVTGGAIDEVRSHRERDGERSRPGTGGITSAIGYPEICRYLDGGQDLEATIDQVASATRRYARRQLTWLRKLRDAIIIDVDGRTSEEIVEDILAHLHGEQ